MTREHPGVGAQFPPPITHYRRRNDMTTTNLTTWRGADAQARSTYSRSPRGWGRRLSGDAGEGVISAAIAVLIMAFLGAAM